MDKKIEIAARDKTHLLPDDARAPTKEMSAYNSALYCAGVDVMAAENFGSYQGDWWAEIMFPNGEIYYVNGSFGSCSYCDAFEAEFGWNNENQPNYLQRLRDFGREYLTNCMTIDQAIEQASKNIEWDSDAGAMISWLESRRIERERQP